MGTKNNPGAFDCYANALPDEPMFVLLGRDPHAPTLIRQWSDRRLRLIDLGQRPLTDRRMVAEARACASAMEEWRDENDGAWRKATAPIPSVESEAP